MDEVSKGLVRGRSRCKLEKFPYGSKMSTTLLIEFLMCARCFSRTLSEPFLCVCVLYMCMCVCFKSHLEQIVDSKPDQPLPRDDIGSQFGFKAVAFRNS